MTEHHTTPAIEVQDLHKYYGEHEVIKGMSLRAFDGDVVTIIGSSGSGKSTFLRCINLLENPTAGSISIDGEPLTFRKNKVGDLVSNNRRQLERVRTQLGMVFQRFNLWEHRTALQNVIEAPLHVQKMTRSEATEIGEAMLQKVGLWEKRNQFPAVLSGGQQQRVAIARALAIQPKALLFDEPTSALDPELVGGVLRVIRELAEEGRTMIMVTHEMAFARNVSSRVVFLDNGRIEEQGTPDHVFTASESARCRQFLKTH